MHKEYRWLQAFHTLQHSSGVRVALWPHKIFSTPSYTSGTKALTSSSESRFAAVLPTLHSRVAGLFCHFHRMGLLTVLPAVLGVSLLLYLSYTRAKFASLPQSSSDKAAAFGQTLSSGVWSCLCFLLLLTSRHTRCVGLWQTERHDYPKVRQTKH